MNPVYEAANGVEAHMIADLLKQQGIEARVDGAFLQGAVGGLPAHGLVRVMVEPESQAAARAIIDAWHKAEAEQAADRPSSPAPRKRWPFFLAGLMLGIGASYVYVRVPVTMRGIDHGSNRSPDEIWTYSARNLPLKWEADRNLDGKIDIVTWYDDQGHPSEVKADDNFDGVFEFHGRYRAGNMAVSASDTNGDGFEDLRSHYTGGVLTKNEYLEPKTGKVLKVEYISLGKLVRAETDTNGDGKMDRLTTYDTLGEVARTEEIRP